jgi:hypothetical protein
MNSTMTVSNIQITDRPNLCIVTWNRNGKKYRREFFGMYRVNVRAFISKLKK